MTERTQFITANLSTALMERMFPAVTIWNRLEGRPRTANFNRALKAEVRDALWMLTRQWQMGEFHGDDAGSTIEAKIRVTTSRIRKYRAGPDGPIEKFDESLPLETKVERRPLSLSLDLRLLMGRQWLKMIFADLRTEFLGKYKFPDPDPTAPADFPICAHAEAWGAFAAHAGRRMDGGQLYEHLAGGGHAWDDIAGVAGREGDIDLVATRFMAWFDKLIAKPSGPTAWIPSRLEYQFACSAPKTQDEKVLVAEEYYQGHLDWYSVDIDPAAPRLGDPSAAEPGNPATERKVVVPTPATFDGMPNTRWWAFEDSKTNFGDIKPDTTDLPKLLLIEFGLTFANDWFVVPYVLPAGSIAHVDGVAVTNVFGERFWIKPAGSGLDDNWQRWAMFLVNIKGRTRDFADTSLLLLPVASKIDESKPFEEVMLVRDEIANMVWGIENVIPLPTGEPKRGVEAARELLAFYEQDVRRRNPVPLEPPPPPAPSAVVRYELMNTVPENWIPFVPVHRDGEIRSVQLQRASMLRILAGDDKRPEKVRPRTALLREGLAQKQPYFLHEEEVPRAGVVVRQSYQRTRWRDGRAWVWIGARKQTGRGEASSGLAFDRVIDIPPKK